MIKVKDDVLKAIENFATGGDPRYQWIKKNSFTPIFSEFVCYGKTMNLQYKCFISGKTSLDDIVNEFKSNSEIDVKYISRVSDNEVKVASKIYDTFIQYSYLYTEDVFVHMLFITFNSLLIPNHNDIYKEIMVILNPRINFTNGKLINIPEELLP